MPYLQDTEPAGKTEEEIWLERLVEQRRRKGFPAEMPRGITKRFLPASWKEYNS